MSAGSTSFLAVNANKVIRFQKFCESRSGNSGRTFHGYLEDIFGERYIYFDEIHRLRFVRDKKFYNQNSVPIKMNVERKERLSQSGPGRFLKRINPRQYPLDEHW